MATNTSNFGFVKPEYTDTADIDVINDNMDSLDGILSGMQDSFGIVVDGDQAAVSATTGQYIILRNSEIAGCTDGLYTAAKAIPAETTIDSTYLTAVSGGGLNALNDKIANYETVTFTPATGVTFMSGTITKRAGITVVSLWIKITDSAKRSPNSVLGTFSQSVGSYKRISGTSQGNLVGWFAVDGTSLKVENNYTVPDAGNYGYLINFVTI